MSNKLLDQMLEHLVNDEKEKAEELFHEYVVTKSREIYESLIEEEMKDDEEDDEDVDEAAKDEDAEEDKVEEASESDDDEVDENFEDLAIEADDDDDMDMMGGDPTDDLASELDDEDNDDDMEEKDPEELFQDLDAIVDELQAKFDAMQGGGDEGDMDDMDDEMKDDFDLETVREYVEKVPAGHGAEKKGTAEKADSTKSLIDNMKNDMGGTTANILSSKEDSVTLANQGQLKGSSLSGQKPKEDNAGNINVPGAKNGNAFNKKEPGHGAEKKGAAEDADKSAGSLFRGRR